MISACRTLMATAMIATTFAVVPGPALADVLVVRSQGAVAHTFPPGRSLADTASLALAVGDSVTVLGPSGTRTFRGPGRFPVTGAVRAGGIAGAIGNPRTRSRIGAVRGGAGSSNPWLVAAGNSGTACVVDQANFMLWRPDPRLAERLSIIAAGGDTVELAWPAGSSTVQWPTRLPVRDGIEYRLSMSGAQPSRLMFVTVATAPRDLQQVAAILIRHGCNAQLDRLIETTRTQ